MLYHGVDQFQHFKQLIVICGSLGVLHDKLPAGQQELAAYAVQISLHSCNSRSEVDAARVTGNARFV